MRLFTHLSLAALVLAALFQFTVVRSVDRGAANSMAQIAQELGLPILSGGGKNQQGGTHDCKDMQHETVLYHFPDL